MQKLTLLTLASAKTLSYFEPCFQDYHIHQCHSLDSMKSFLRKTASGLILAEFPKCTSRHVEAFMALRSEMIMKNSHLNLMFFSQSIDFSVYQKFPRDRSLLLVSEAEKQKAPMLASKFLQGQPVFLRNSERQPMESPVLVKSTDWTGQLSTPRTKGRFIDFAQQGARLYLPQKIFKVKDYISVLYQSSNKDWITVECQLRWEHPTPDGGQMLGIQFLAIA